MYRSEYIVGYCARCQCQTERLRITRIDGGGTETCSFCSEVSAFEEENVKRKYVVSAIHDKVTPDLKRRLVKAEIRREIIPENAAEEGSVSYFEVAYPAYGNEHYPTSIEPVIGTRTPNHVEAAAITQALKEVIK